MFRHVARPPGPRGIGEAARGSGAMAIYAKIKGKIQGDIKGSVMATGHTGEIEINSCEMGLASPVDIASGHPAGRRQWRPIHLVKPLDASTALLYNAIVTNELLTSVVITYWRTGLDGKPSNFIKISLTNAMIVDYNHLGNNDGTGTEKVSLTFTKWEFSWLPTSLGAVDDWMTTS
jgi:type VI secretion system secreted protein Hcp